MTACLGSAAAPAILASIVWLAARALALTHPSGEYEEGRVRAPVRKKDSEKSLIVNEREYTSYQNSVLKKDKMKGGGAVTCDPALRCCCCVLASHKQDSARVADLDCRSVCEQLFGV